MSISREPCNFLLTILEATECQPGYMPIGMTASALAQEANPPSLLCSFITL